MTALAVVVPAGGRARRLDGDKLEMDVGGRTLLDRTLDSLPTEAFVVCVGSPLPTARAVVWVEETPQHAGPLRAVEAGVTALPVEVSTVVLVGGDMPRAGAAIEALVAALSSASTDGDRVRCAAVVDGSGRVQPMLSAWPRPVLTARLAALAPTAGRALSALLDGVLLVPVDDMWEAATDVDTPDQLAAERERHPRPDA